MHFTFNKVKQTKNKYKKQSGGAKKIMARLAGIDLPREKRVEIGLTYIYGIGFNKLTKNIKSSKCKPRHKE